ncbi:PAS domain-containing protein [Anaerosporobacter sp.]|uniref:PAS domain-containing protein n=1 Tax=Anaerosporobacter sp. TaxID=1872529 RepID=UPI00286F5BF4|nr:PAS domain-containing protein [Anaerosporobacter sp.]
MRIDEKLKYQQLIDGISFPVVIYTYETYRIIAINENAKNILVPNGKMLKYMPNTKLRKQIRQQVMAEESELLFNVAAVFGNQEVNVDIEINSIELDGKHIIILLLDYTENQSFTDKSSNHVPRFFWKDKKLKLKGANYFYYEDVRKRQINCDEIESSYDRISKDMLMEKEIEILNTKEPSWNVLQLIQYKNGTEKFINTSRIPIINRNGTVTGILGNYQLVLGKKELEEELEWLESEKNRLTKLLVANDAIFLRVRTDSEWSVEYVTPNIEKLGYTSKDFYVRKINFRKLIVKEDLRLVLREFMSVKKQGAGSLVMEYRIRKADETPIWVKSTCVYMSSEKDPVKYSYIDVMLSDITEVKTLKKELEISKDIAKTKLEMIKKGEIPIKLVRFTDLFKLEEILTTTKNFSDMMNISCVITDYVGKLLCKIMRHPFIEEEVYQYYEGKEGRDAFRSLYKLVRDKESNYIYDKKRKIYVYAVPFRIEDKCIGVFNVLSKEEMPSDSPVLLFLNDVIEKLCSSVEMNIEMLREKDRRESAEFQLRIEQRKSEFLNKELEIALTEDDWHSGLNKIIRNLTQYIDVGETLLFHQVGEEDYYEKLFEWSTNGEENRKITQVREQINLKECEELLYILKHRSMVVYQQGEMPEYLQGQFYFRKVKSLAMIMLEFEWNETIIIAFCDKNTEPEWTNEKIGLMTDVVNIIKVMLQKTIIKREILPNCEYERIVQQFIK